MPTIYRDDLRTGYVLVTEEVLQHFLEERLSSYEPLVDMKNAMFEDIMFKGKIGNTWFDVQVYYNYYLKSQRRTSFLRDVLYMYSVASGHRDMRQTIETYLESETLAELESKLEMLREEHSFCDLERPYEKFNAAVYAGDNASDGFAYTFYNTTMRKLPVYKLGFIEWLYTKEVELSKGFSVEVDVDDTITADQYLSFSEVNTAPDNTEVMDEIKKVTLLGGLTDSIDSTLGYIFEPIESYVAEMNERYDDINKRISSGQYSDSTCDILKTVIYLAIYYGRSSSTEGALDKLKDYMNKICSAEQNWATGTSDTSSPSFYGKSDGWKAFYAYYPFMENERNPYRQYINNSVADEMDSYALAMHKYLEDHNVESIISEAFYKPIGNSGISVYGALGLVKEFLEVLNDKIVVTGADLNIKSYFVGIISSLINSAWKIIDIQLTEVMKSLFYKKFIPIGSDKWSTKELYNYITFLKLLLENGFNEEDEVDALNSDDYIKAVFKSANSDKNKLEQYGWGCFDREFPIYISENVYKYSDGNFWEAKYHSPLFYSIVQFAIQKLKYKSSSRDDVTLEELRVNLASRRSIKALYNTLTEKELFWLCESYYIYYLDLDDINYDYDDFSSLNLYNEGLKRALVSIYGHNSKTFYEAYKTISEKELLDVAMSASDFDKTSLDNYFQMCLREYGVAVENSSEAIEDEVFKTLELGVLDDFLVRFTPSMKVLMRVVGINSNNLTVATFVKILEQLLYFIDTTVIEGMFLELKKAIEINVKSFTADMFDDIARSGKTNTFLFDFGLTGSTLPNTIDGLMKLIDNIALDSVSLNCFSKDTSESNAVEGNITIKDYTTDSIYTAIISRRKIEELIEAEEKLAEEYDKLIYSDGSIYGETKGVRTKIISADDTSSSSSSSFYSGDVVVYENIVKIRDMISNSISSDYNSLLSEKLVAEKTLADKIAGGGANYSDIKELEEKISELTEEINNVKKELKVDDFADSLETNYSPDEETQSEIVVVNLQAKNDLLKAFAIIQKTEEVAIEMSSPLTNSDLLKILK